MLLRGTCRNAPWTKRRRLCHCTIRSRSKAALDDTWSDWFDGLRITHDAAGDTLLEGAVRDQTALYGLLAKARDLQLTLIAVEQRTSAMKADPATTLGYTDDVSQ